MYIYTYQHVVGSDGRLCECGHHIRTSSKQPKRASTVIHIHSNFTFSYHLRRAFLFLFFAACLWYALAVLVCACAAFVCIQKVFCVVLVFKNILRDDLRTHIVFTESTEKWIETWDIANETHTMCISSYTLHTQSPISRHPSTSTWIRTFIEWARIESILYIHLAILMWVDRAYLQRLVTNKRYVIDARALATRRSMRIFVFDFPQMLKTAILMCLPHTDCWLLG